MKLKDIKPNPENPRIIKDEKFKQLVKSIKDFPQMLELRPLVVDENNVILGGNMRYRAMVEAGLKDAKVIVAEGLTDEQKKEFIIKDNLSFGEWDWNVLANEWEIEQLENWGLDIIGTELDPDKLSENFSLPEGEKPPFQQITFTLADEQAVQIKNALDTIKETEEFKYCETMGNENSNGNALYLLAMQWAGQRK